MRRILQSVAIVSVGVLLGQTAFAADFPANPPQSAIMAPAFSWTGFYLGINGGGMWNGGTGGGLIGGTAGYNVQNGPWVLGVEGDLDYVTSGGRNYFGTVRGRVGYTWDRLLPYVTGGVAFTDGDTSGVVGAGLEYAFAPQLSAKAEYLYAWNNGGGHILRVGVNYHF